MFISYVAYDGKTLSLTTGNGPTLIGHYMSSAEWRVSSALLASIASRIPDVMIGVACSGGSIQEIEALTAPQGMVEWRRLSLEAIRNTERGGVAVSSDGNVVFLPSDRDEIDDCVYRSFAKNACFVAPATCRSIATSVDGLEQGLRKEARVEIAARYFDIDILIHDSSIRDLVVDRVARVVAYFNQF